MSDEPVTSDELKAAIRPAKAVIARILARNPQNYQADQADKALDQVRDFGLRALENEPAPKPEAYQIRRSPPPTYSGH
jgi:hypothetical protein